MNPLHRLPTGETPAGETSAGIATRFRDARTDEDGAILVLALVFLIVVSLTVYTVSTWAGNSLDQAVKFNSASALNYATGAAVEVEAQSLRYAYQSGNTTADLCMPNNQSSMTINSVSVVVYCTIVDASKTSASRTITFYACATNVSEVNCLSGPYLEATISFDDYSEQTDTNSCKSSYDELSCGTAMSITGWDVV